MPVPTKSISPRVGVGTSGDDLPSFKEGILLLDVDSANDRFKWVVGIEVQFTVTASVDSSISISSVLVVKPM